MYSVDHNENGLTSELTNEELDMIQRSLLVILPRSYIELLKSECNAKEEHFPKQSPEPSKDLTEPASTSCVIVIEPDIELDSSVTESVDRLDAPKHSSFANQNVCVVSQCTENGEPVPTETASTVTMASEKTNVSTFVSCNEVVQNGFLENSSTGKNVDTDKAFVQENKTLPKPTDSSGIDSRQILSGCKSPVELYMAAAPQFLKNSTRSKSSPTFKSESLFKPSELDSVRLKADPGSVSALFPTFRRFHSQSGCSRRKLFNHRQVLTAEDECSDSSSPTASSFVSSDSETLSSRSLTGDLEHCVNNASIQVRSPEVLFQKPLLRQGSSGCKKRKLFNSSEVLCPAAEKDSSPQKESFSETTVSPISGKTSCSLHHVDKHVQKACGTVETSSPQVGEEVLSSFSVPVGKLYSETLALCLKKRSVKGLEPKSNHTSAESTEKENNLTDKQDTAELDLTTAEKSPSRQHFDGANNQMPDKFPVESDIVNVVRIQELLNASSLSVEQQKAMHNKPFPDKLRKFAFSYFRNYSS